MQLARALGLDQGAEAAALGLGQIQLGPGRGAASEGADIGEIAALEVDPAEADPPLAAGAFARDVGHARPRHQERSLDLGAGGQARDVGLALSGLHPAAVFADGEARLEQARALLAGQSDLLRHPRQGLLDARSGGVGPRRRQGRRQRRTS